MDQHVESINKQRFNISTALIGLYVFLTIALGQTSMVQVANTFYVLFAVVSLLTIFRIGRIKLYTEGIIIVIFCVILSISLLFTGFAQESLIRYRTVVLLETIPLFLLLGNWKQNTAVIEGSIVIGALLLGIISWEMGGISTSTRLDTIANSNAVGLSLAVACVITFYYLLTTKRNLLLIPYFLGAALILFTQSKSALILMVLFSAALLFMLKDEVRSWKKILVVIVIVAVVYIVYSLGMLRTYTYRISRMLTFFSTNNSYYDFSTYTRMELKKTGIQMFLEKPLFGHGIGQSNNLLGGDYFHDNYVQLLVELGIVGFITYYSLIVSCLVKSIKLRDQFTTILLMFILASDIFNSMYYQKITYIIIGLCILRLLNSDKQMSIEISNEMRN